MLIAQLLAIFNFILLGVFTYVLEFVSLNPNDSTAFPVEIVHDFWVRVMALFSPMSITLYRS